MFFVFFIILRYFNKLYDLNKCRVYLDGRKHFVADDWLWSHNWRYCNLWEHTSRIILAYGASGDGVVYTW